MQTSFDSWEAVFSAGSRAMSMKCFILERCRGERDIKKQGRMTKEEIDKNYEKKNKKYNKIL